MGEAVLSTCILVLLAVIAAVIARANGICSANRAHMRYLDQHRAAGVRRAEREAENWKGLAAHHRSRVTRLRRELYEARKAKEASDG